MSKAITTDRKASAAEVRAHARSLRRIAKEVGITDPRLRDDGTVIVHSEHPGYRDVVVLSQRSQRPGGLPCPCDHRRRPRR